MDGMLIIRKEKGYTSFDVVAKLRGILHMKKIGHTGTLDPDAEGVLPVALGAATRLVDLFTEKKKTYEAVLHLGITTDTQDMTGTILAQKEVSVSEEDVQNVISGFLGDQMQVPPMYSALKVNGKKLCDLAREGQTVERKARPVHFYEITVQEISLPLVRFTVTCSKGTYIRTLCNDIGEKLGCGGCMESLVRTKSGEFSIEESVTLAEVQRAADEGRAETLVQSIEEVLAQFPRTDCDAQGSRLLANGNALPEVFVSPAVKDGWVRMYAANGEFIAIYEWDPRKEMYHPVKMFYPGKA
jgi:tRNA pseudouridine55 synthase